MRWIHTFCSRAESIWIKNFKKDLCILRRLVISNLMIDKILVRL